MMYLRQSTAQVIKVGPFLDETDGKTAETALTLTNTDFRLSKDGGNFASSSAGSGTHDELGCYDKTLSTTDTNTVGELVVHVHESGALPVTHRYWVLEEAVYDLIFGASADMEVTVAAMNAGVVTAAAIGADAITSTKIADDAFSLEHFDDELKVTMAYGDGVWFDDSSGNPGTTIGDDGTIANPVDNFDNAVTLAGTTGLQKVYVLNCAATPSSGVGGITVVAVGAGASYNFASQTHTNTVIEGFSNGGVFGICGASSRATVRGGIFSSSQEFLGEVVGAGLTGTIEPASGWTYLSECFHAASTSLTLDMNNNSANVAASKFSGAVTITNMDSTNQVILDGNATVTIDSSCTGGTVIVRGQVDTTDNSGGAVTITAITGVNLTQLDGETDRIDKLADYMDVTERTTVTSASTTSIVATGLTSTADDVYIDRVGRFITGTIAGEGFVVQDYDGATKTLTITQLSQAPSAGDRFILET